MVRHIYLAALRSTHEIPYSFELKVFVSQGVNYRVCVVSKSGRRLSRLYALLYVDWQGQTGCLAVELLA